MEITRDIFNRLNGIASRCNHDDRAELLRILCKAEEDLKDIPKAGDDPVPFLPREVQDKMGETIKEKFRYHFKERNLIWCIKLVKDCTGMDLFDTKRIVDDIWPMKGQ